MNQRRGGRVAGRVGLVVAGAVAARGLLAALRSSPPGGQSTWTRTNHRGEQVSLLAGPALIGAATLTAATGAPCAPLCGAALVAGAGAGAVG
ncbi:MAG TPA: hypothetical protein VIS06_22760, partial [Mycobacteriales bacterium]